MMVTRSLHMLADTRRLGGSVLQTCAYPAIESLTADQLTKIRDTAARYGIALELGTRGVESPTCSSI
ncbi:hypothetical protein ACFVKB_29630 [Rhodococcus sp. NPDC127530]|uniref:hypothetical protein n=1 Tax=unclassified Rhodococcus (in: high G+C Gram-positive bacteria) TaxID=192944 RepID=UPI0036335108